MMQYIDRSKVDFKRLCSPFGFHFENESEKLKFYVDYTASRKLKDVKRKIVVPLYFKEVANILETTDFENVKDNLFLYTLANKLDDDTLRYIKNSNSRLSFNIEVDVLYVTYTVTIILVDE